MCGRETFVLAEGLLVELLVSVLGSGPASGLRVSPRQVGRCSALCHLPQVSMGAGGEGLLAALPLLQWSSSFLSSLFSFSTREALRPAWCFAYSTSSLGQPPPDSPTHKPQLQNCPTCLTYISSPCCLHLSGPSWRYE